MIRLSFFLAAAIVLTGTAYAQGAGTDSSQEQSTTTQTNNQQVNITMTRSTSQPSAAEQQEVRNNLKDVHFAFDQYNLDDQARQALQDNANWLKANPGVTVSIAGNADERGDIPYNLVLSQKRAEAVRDVLVSLGVPAERIQFTTGWGKLYPVCAQADESCWAQNRRAHLTAGTTLQKNVLAMDKLTPAILACATSDCR
jgi:peptidoglycan-associated lipoprotein